jgi:uncharacterized membrane protein YgcG
MFLKKRLIRAAAAALLAIILAAGAVCAEEVITNFDVTVDIAPDSSMTVVENIAITVEHDQIKRGIIRVFPTVYKNPEGREFEVGFEVQNVLLDGEKVPWQKFDSGRTVDIRVGDQNVIVPVGSHVYTIVYKTTRQVGFFEEFDELYWNVTGNDWTFPIESASCKIKLPGKDYGEGFRSIEWYVGAFGSKGIASDAQKLSDNTVITARPLKKKEGLTVVFTWPKGLVTPPPPPRKDNTEKQTYVGMATLAGVLAWLGFAWKKWGKDPVKKAVVPIFYPPNNESAAYLRYVENLRTDDVAFTSMIIELAIKGALKITEEEGIKTFFGREKNRITLYKCEEPKEKLEPEEEAVLYTLFPNDRKELRFGDEFREDLENAKRVLNREIVNRGPAHYTKNSSKFYPALIIYAIGTAMLKPFSGEFPLTLVVVAIFGLLLIFVGMMGGSVTNTKRSMFFRVIRRFLPSLAVAGIVLVAFGEQGMSPVPPTLFFVATGAIASMRPLMAKRTKESTDLLSDIQGLKLYMKTAEKERMEMFNPPEETPRLYERLLPYAYALDIAETWANRFEKILKDAQYKPEWFDGISTDALTSGIALNNFANQVVKYSAPKVEVNLPDIAPSSSSGSGGGGYSGGGGGGGGGRGW